ncbi:DRM1 [Acrasis kona]|uniref:DRM1 n=1 Tax=Acrasis kona TaxID=1008807 RepID=A0AAW2Z5V8_9EUKA
MNTLLVSRRCSQNIITGCSRFYAKKQNIIATSTIKDIEKNIPVGEYHEIVGATKRPNPLNQQSFLRQVVKPKIGTIVQYVDKAGNVKNLIPGEIRNNMSNKNRQHTEDHFLKNYVD